MQRDVPEGEGRNIEPEAIAMRFPGSYQWQEILWFLWNRAIPEHSVP